MKKAPLLITLGILILLVGGYYSYEKLFSKKPVNVWDLVPSDALFVYEKNQCDVCLQDVASSNILTLIKSATSFTKPDDSLQNKLSTLASSSLLISAHATKKDDLDFIYYTANRSAVDKIIQSLGYKITTRGFNGMQIHEIKFPTHKFSFVEIDEVWIGTYTPFLMEDVIRTYKKDSGSGENRRFQKQNFSSIQDDAGNLYVNLKDFSNGLSLFCSDNQALPFPWGLSTSMDLKTEENSLVLNGFSYDSANDPAHYLLSIFRHQSPVPFGLKHLISNRAIAVSSFGISNGKEFARDLEKFVKLKNPGILDTLRKISSANGININSLYESLGTELAISFQEGAKGRKTSKILLVKTKKPEIWLKTFNTLSAKLSVDTVFFERYSQYEIRELPIYKFSEKLFFPFVSGFAQNFYTSIGDIILIADNLEELKNYLDDIDDEETWGKSVAQNRFLESTLLESNFSLYFNPSRAFNFMLNHLHGKWANFAKENQALVQSIQMSSVQFSHLNSNYYTNILFTYRNYDPSVKVPVGNRDRVLVNFEFPLRHLYAVRSHVNRSNEILLQDSLNDLSLISSEGKVLWKVSIADPIISDVTQIDFFNNGKLQYFFATIHGIHVIDRLGNYVDPYPLQLPSTDIQYVTIVDYDNSKKYRILIGDKKGKLWMYDKEGNSLEGWKPKDIGGPLAFQARHHRIKGKDYLLAVRKDGKIFLMNRRGENLKNFPINIEATPSGDFALDVGPTLSSTDFIIVSDDGFRIKFNPEGKIERKEPLLKTSVMSSFSLIQEKASKSYLIGQQDSKQLTLMDESGKKIFSTEASSVNATDVKYYDFGSGNVFILLSDRAQGLSYVYDYQGNLLTTPPIESSSIEMRPGNSDRFVMFFIHGSVLTIQPL